jgi:hypothetical protein
VGGKECVSSFWGAKLCVMCNQTAIIRTSSCFWVARTMPKATNLRRNARNVTRGCRVVQRHCTYWHRRSPFRSPYSAASANFQASLISYRARMATSSSSCFYAAVTGQAFATSKDYYDLICSPGSPAGDTSTAQQLAACHTPSQSLLAKCACIQSCFAVQTHCLRWYM